VIVNLQRRLSQRRDGIAAIEAALMLPLLFGLMFGIWEVGQLVHVNEYVNASVREGARLAATGNYSSTSTPNPTTATTYDVQSEVGNYLKNNGLTIPGAGVIITVTNETQNLVQTGVASMDPNNPGQVMITGTGSTPSADPVLNSNQFDILRVDVQYPFSFARWSPNNLFFYLGSNPLVTASTRWCCLRDIPVTVNSTIPNTPLTPN
jgi:Flp pilus assembly protein TadG